MAKSQMLFSFYTPRCARVLRSTCGVQSLTLPLCVHPWVLRKTRRWTLAECGHVYVTVWWKGFSSWIKSFKSLGESFH